MIRVARRVRQCDGVVNSAVQVARLVHIVAAVAACHAWGPRRRGRGHGGGGPVDACALAEGREPRVALRRRDPGARPPQTTTSLSACFSSRPAVCVKSTMLRGYMPISTRVSSKRMLNINQSTVPMSHPERASARRGGRAHTTREPTRPCSSCC
jgi:hypothetical protein